MRFELRDYQEDALRELFEKSERMLKSSEQKTCVFKAPTGSGKTVVVAELLRKLVKEKKDNILSFVWIAPRKLHEQSKKNLESNYEHDQLLTCSNFEDLQDNKIDQNEILFFNWESINKKNNIYIMDNEQNNNLSTVIQNTHESGHKLILIIDESHFAAAGEKSLQIIHDLKPDVTLEISATPNLKDIDHLVSVDLQDVIDDEMIKNEIRVNPEFLKIKVGVKEPDDIVIEQALKRREDLKRKLEKEGSKVNPLVLIQLPDQKSKMVDNMDNVVKKLKNKHKITEENGKLAIWLSEIHSDTLANIEKNDNEVEVLIFKQAIAIGWDCPRASILVVFREYKSKAFTIQTIGRIMRMPERKYYQTSELNKGYIFTNMQNIDLTQEYVKDYVSQYESHRNESLYKPIKLKSIYLKRQRERTRLSSKFVKIFNRTSITKTLKSKININPTKVVRPILSDGLITNIDKAGEIEIKGQIEVKASAKGIQSRFDDFVTNACKPYAPHDSSDRMKTALYKFLEDEFGLEKYDTKAQMVVLGIENYQVFWDAINEAKVVYETEVVQQVLKKREQDVTADWEVPKVVSFKGEPIEMKKLKSIMQPFYSKKLSRPEENFIKRLDESDKIKWWYKNGESEIKYFSVPYIDENGVEKGFYVDFIIRFQNGTVGLFDTKSGRTAADADTRHDGLYKYIQNEMKNGKDFIGGIIVESNETWRYNDKKEYHFDENDMSDWKILDF
jgi:type III restriction enzyme